MKKPEINVRLKGVSFRNIKNIKNASIDFPIEKNIDKNGRNNIFGIYGPNGTGKTSLINCLGVLKKLLCEIPLGKSEYNLIDVNSKTAELTFSFDTQISAGFFFLTYTVVLEKTITTIDGKESNSVTIKSEKLKYKPLGNSDSDIKNLSTLIDIDSTTAIGKDLLKPTNYYSKLMAIPSFFDSVVRLSIGTRATRQTFIFKHEFLNVLFKTNDFDETYKMLLNQIKFFGMANLFVIDQVNNNNISLNLGYRHIDEQKAYISMGTININGVSRLSEKEYLHYEKSINEADRILEKLIPGISIKAQKLRDNLLPNGDKGVDFILVSYREDNGGKPIPFSSESNGIRSIFSVLSLVVAAYNNPSVCIAIDEFDAGVFEHLLGLIVKVYAESGKGLFIFTSHNLRPLEVLNPANVFFTTKEDKLFEHTTYVRKELNKRNAYLRLMSISDSNSIYLTDEVKEHELRSAFRRLANNE